ncbi:MAG: hypothetical protein ACR2H6_01740 [Pyrinomonadaceae bacterium]
MRRRILQVGVAVLILMAILTVGYFFLFLRLARVPTSSMANTIIPGDRILAKPERSVKFSEAMSFFSNTMGASFWKDRKGK